MKKSNLNSIVSSFNRIEDLLKEILYYIPYCNDHKNVWSDSLIMIIMESCSILDSLWKFQAQNSSCIKKNHFTFLDYFKYFGQSMSKRWIVFWGEEPNIIYPFSNWSKNNSFKTKDDMNTLNWWKSYTNLKHNRLKNRNEAKIEYSIQSLSALFLAMIKCPELANSIENANWLSGIGNNLKASLKEDSKSVKGLCVVVESKLFSYPVAWFNEKIEKKQEWFGPSSSRFKDWFYEYES